MPVSSPAAAASTSRRSARSAGGTDARPASRPGSPAQWLSARLLPREAPATAAPPRPNRKIVAAIRPIETPHSKIDGAVGLRRAPRACGPGTSSRRARRSSGCRTTPRTARSAAQKSMSRRERSDRPERRTSGTRPPSTISAAKARPILPEKAPASWPRSGQVAEPEREVDEQRPERDLPDGCQRGVGRAAGASPSRSTCRSGRRARSRRRSRTGRTRPASPATTTARRACSA